MKFAFRILMFGLMCVVSSLQAADDSTVLVVMAPNGPVFVEMQITVDDESYQSWVTSFLADRIDVDGNKKLSLDELRLVPDRLLKQAKAGNPKRLLRRASGSKDAEAVDADQFVSWFGKQLDRGFNIIAASVQASEAVRLAAHLDANGDGKVARSEVENAAHTMRFRDLDDDQTFSASELLPFRDPRNQRAAIVPDAADLPFVQLTDDATIERTADQVLRRFGADGKVDTAFLRLPTSATFDKDGDDAFDRAELVELMKAAQSHLLMQVQLSDRANSSDLKIEIPETAASFCQTKPSNRRGRTSLVVDEMPISIRARGGSKASRGFMVNFVLQRTSVYDEDKNGYLSAEEFPGMLQQLSQVQVTGTFKDIDLNGDEMVFREEIKAYIERDAIATQSRIDVSVKQDGKTLFKLLDENKDRRLSLRELKYGFDKLLEYDISKDEHVTEAELGTAYALEISMGTPESLRMTSMRSPNMMNGNPTDAILPGVGGLDGPEWFRRMDRNQDRDVSRREFLGPREIFTKLDTDGDNLLNAKEAEQLSGSDE